MGDKGLQEITQVLAIKNYIFNYIVTIHNKEEIIGNVITNLLRCASINSNICLVLDGCNDKTEIIIDQIICDNKNRRIFKVFTNDVHELKAINAGLRNLNHEGHGFNIILQDDVVLDDTNLEKKVIDLYEWGGPTLGIVSFRHGANLSRLLSRKKGPILPLSDYIESVKGHSIGNSNPLNIGEFVFREIAVKSPICVPFLVTRTVGLPDESFAPWDDINYCYQVLLNGYNNGVLGISFTSELEWGSMRTKQQRMSHEMIMQKNIQLFKSKNVPLIKKRPIYNSIIYVFENNNVRQKKNILFAEKILFWFRTIKRYLKKITAEFNQ